MSQRRGFVHLDEACIGRLIVNKGAIAALFKASCDVDSATFTTSGTQPTVGARPSTFDVFDAVLIQGAGLT